MQIKSLFVAAAFALALPAGLALAQTAPQTTTAPVAKPTATPTVKPTAAAPTATPTATPTRTARVRKAKSTVAAKPRSAISLACSAEANDKKLTGKPRKAFRKTCMAAKLKAAK